MNTEPLNVSVDYVPTALPPVGTPFQMSDIAITFPPVRNGRRVPIGGRAQRKARLRKKHKKASRILAFQGYISRCDMVDAAPEWLITITLGAKP